MVASMLTPPETCQVNQQREVRGDARQRTEQGIDVGEGWHERRELHLLPQVIGQSALQAGTPGDAEGGLWCHKELPAKEQAETWRVHDSKCLARQ